MRLPNNEFAELEGNLASTVTKAAERRVVLSSFLCLV